MGVERDLLIKTGSSIREAMLILERSGFGAVVVVDEEDHLQGLITDGDLRRALLAGTDLDSVVETVMKVEPFFAVEGTSEDEIRSHLSEEIRHIPVIDQGRRVTRIVSFFSHGLTGMSPRLPVAAPSLGEREVQAVADAVRSGWVSSQGAYVRRFQSEFAGFCGTRYGSATSTGTAALHLALAALRIRPGDEVIVPSLSFIAVANAVSYMGATPVFADSDPVTWCMDPSALEALVTEKTRAIVVVHLYGHPADMDPILDLAERHGLVVVEDAAEAHGATYRGRVVGSMGALGCFSFYGNKIITTGEGGMVVTDDENLWARVEFLKNHAMSNEGHYLHPEIGFNYRMTNLQAALGVAQLEQINHLLEQKRRVAGAYEKGLAGVAGITTAPSAEWAESVYWMFSILVGPEYRLSSDGLRSELAAHGIETRPFFRPQHLQPAFANGTSLQVAERLSAEGVNLPSSSVLTDEQIDFVCDLIRTLGG